jgi:hypothetical protein
MSHRPHPAQDIVAGSRWPSARGPGCATVRAVAAGYVDFTFNDGAVVAHERLHHEQFRRLYIEPYDSRSVRSWFSMSLANLQACHVFWSRALRRGFARNISRAPDDSRAAARGSPAIPADAMYVGTYSSPFAPDAFLDDLNDTLATEADGTTAAA